MPADPQEPPLPAGVRSIYGIIAGLEAKLSEVERLTGAAGGWYAKNWPSNFKNGGGGGNRTPVRKQSTEISTRLVLDFISPGGAPQNRLPTGQPSTVSSRRQKA